MQEMPLTELEAGSEGKILLIEGGFMAVKRLADLGLTKGTKIKIIKKAPFRGPVKIEVRGARLVLGRGLAAKILVNTE